MIKKIKEKIKFWKQLIFEVLETLCLICLYLEYDGRRTRNPYAQFLESHERELRTFSRVLFSEVKEDE